MTHTPIDISHLKKANPAVSVPREAEPMRATAPHEITPHQEESSALEDSSADEAQEVEESAEEEAVQSSPQQIEDRPDEVELDEELTTAGVQQSPHQSFFANNKEVHLPIPIEEVDHGMHQPMTSGLRWIAEISMLILAKFHKTIKRVGGMLQIVDKQ